MKMEIEFMKAENYKIGFINLKSNNKSYIYKVRIVDEYYTTYEIEYLCKFKGDKKEPTLFTYLPKKNEVYDIYEVNVKWYKKLLLKYGFCKI